MIRWLSWHLGLSRPADDAAECAGDVTGLEPNACAEDAGDCFTSPSLVLVYPLV